MNRRVLAMTAFVLVAAVAAGLLIKKHATTPNATRPTVVASFYPLYNFAKEVAGDKADVSNVTPAGAEPHDYEPTPADLVKAQKADVFVYDGATLEPWVDKFLPGFKNTTVRASNGIDLQASSEDPAATDPHFWLDPDLAAKIVDNIASGLAGADTDNAGYYRQRATEYKTKLSQLDEEFQNGTKTCQLRTIVTSHDAFSYLAKRYNFEVVSIAGLSPDQEPGAGKLAELTKIIKDKHIPYVFFESLVSPRLAGTIAAETGAKTAVFDPVEGITDEEQKAGKDYLSVQRDNLAALHSAMACQ